MENRTIETVEMEKRPNRRRVVLIAAIVCCIAILAVGTTAYFTAEETSYNVIVAGVLDMEMHEETTGGKPWPKEGIEGVLPGVDIDKKVYLENTGGVDFWCRISIDKVIEAAADVDVELDFTNITLDIDEENWTEKDGWFYYNKALKPTEETVPLFTKVQFGKDLGNEYMNCRVKIDVTAQSVQCRNNGESALEAAGWPETEAE